ncbi:MAG: hypothetical protein AAF821_27040 [Cyanobacteria bacterium P01_D01_bin.156]
MKTLGKLAGTGVVSLLLATLIALDLSTARVIEERYLFNTNNMWPAFQTQILVPLDQPIETPTILMSELPTIWLYRLDVSAMLKITATLSSAIATWIQPVLI